MFELQKQHDEEIDLKEKELASLGRYLTEMELQLAQKSVAEASYVSKINDLEASIKEERDL